MTRNILNWITAILLSVVLIAGSSYVLILILIWLRNP
jgi:hypothetical protein